MSSRRTVYMFKYLYMIAGFAIIAVGIDMQRQAQVGLPSYGVLHQGIAIKTMLTFGQASILVSLLCIVISTLLAVKPRMATILNMLFIGYFVDWFYPVVVSLQTADKLWQQLLLFLAGTALVAWGIAMYISANLGSGPRDSLMLALVKKIRQRVGLVVTGIESIVLVLGFLLGGPVGWGTIISALTMGWFVEIGLKFFRWVGTMNRFSQVIQVTVEQSAKH
ncbi:hypothetical protein MFMK1_000886 [Metallumcola ferriviriculae]|uniref:YitT family protein n=1 Tax=Metallumcola ferriviriculae TaxID=3039180 RepID=A0AAU0UL28_9FIRM|nr:hypothetical protein MFMK1_000886 [Desulfitibacteraceae bacterium MK1]